MGLQFPFMDDNAVSSHSSCRRALRVRILNVWIGRHDLRISIPSVCMKDFLGRRLAARTLPASNDSVASIGATRRMGSNVSTAPFDAHISQHGQTL
ncbi:hypothetical protein TNCV_1234041 [Trichonephila clavipes]|nr:hypothetical protein TNCV_1234041 [Trichonephila clavipes]